jgi:hypothetical protein
MPQENEPVRKTTKQIQTEIALRLRQNGSDGDRFPEPLPYENRNLQRPTRRAAVSQRCSPSFPMASFYSAARRSQP